jgi:hypothetical protein
LLLCYVIYGEWREGDRRRREEDWTNLLPIL